MLKFEEVGLADLKDVAQKILDHLVHSKDKFILLNGEMGAGKTTFTSVLMDLMGVEDHGSSPTFSIINEYFSVNYGKIYHFDFYRIENEIEAYDIGIEEIFEEDAYCFLEWPQRIQNLLPQNTVSINITIEGQKRTIELTEL
ncbi:MAG: tRNA threonylcarbamoyladenosine biosynthesis protein TsaE [Arenicella sp.]|jgi:tRNA threonylcarbamoyladenosine biosynthesis protein TsaE